MDNRLKNIDDILNAIKEFIKNSRKDLLKIIGIELPKSIEKNIVAYLNGYCLNIEMLDDPLLIIDKKFYIFGIPINFEKLNKNQVVIRTQLATKNATNNISYNSYSIKICEFGSCGNMTIRDSDMCEIHNNIVCNKCGKQAKYERLTCIESVFGSEYMCNCCC